jgi:peptide/nickel transport system ATP-binding protein
MTAGTGPSPALEIRDLWVSYNSPRGDLAVVRGVSLVLGRGQLVGLAGESGCGKSTLAHAAARLLPGSGRVTRGQVLYWPPDGEGGEPVDVLRLAGEQLRQFRWRSLSMVFQSAMNSLNPVLRIEAQITDAIRAHDRTVSRKACRERGAELLDLVGVGADRLRSYPHELSGGMRQRTMLAMALALNPQIVIMDEPTTALDVVIQREILDEIRALQERLGFAVLFITHDLSLLLDLADRVVVMYSGLLMEEAPAASLVGEPAHPYTSALLHSFPTVDGSRQRQLVSIGGSPPAAGSYPPGCPFHPRCPRVQDTCRTQAPELAPRPASGHAWSVACWNPMPQAVVSAVPEGNPDGP